MGVKREALKLMLTRLSGRRHSTLFYQSIQTFCSSGLWIPMLSNYFLSLLCLATSCFFLCCSFRESPAINQEAWVTAHKSAYIAGMLIRSSLPYAPLPSEFVCFPGNNGFIDVCFHLHHVLQVVCHVEASQGIFKECYAFHQGHADSATSTRDFL